MFTNMIKAFSFPGFDKSAASDALMDSDDITSNESDDTATDGDTTADPSLND